jgi:hypothetical protein
MQGVRRPRLILASKALEISLVMGIISIVGMLDVDINAN